MSDKRGSVEAVDVFNDERRPFDRNQLHRRMGNGVRAYRRAQGEGAARVPRWPGT